MMDLGICHANLVAAICKNKFLLHNLIVMLMQNHYFMLTKLILVGVNADTIFLSCTRQLGSFLTFWLALTYNIVGNCVYTTNDPLNALNLGERVSAINKYLPQVSLIR
jgi:hypothetical protein